MSDCSENFIVHANVLVVGGLSDIAVDGSSLGGRCVGSKVVNHLSVELLNGLGLSAAGVTTASTGGAVATARTLFGSSSVLGVLLGLGRGGSGLGTRLLTVGT